MTLKAELAKSDAARAYAVASVQSDQKYWNNRRAEHAAMPDGASRDLVVAGTPVIVGETAGNPAVAPAGNVSVARTVPHGTVDTRTASAPSAPTPLAAANVAAWVADESRFDPEGVKALQNEWGADLPANLGYVKHFLHTTFTPEQRERAEAANILSVPVIRFIAQAARENAAPTFHSAVKPGATTKGPPPMSDESRPDALKRFRRLTSDLHAARARMDHLKAREIGDERDALSAQLFPGDGAPTADHSGHQVG
jgi:hypothetical protein